MMPRKNGMVVLGVLGLVAIAVACSSSSDPPKGDPTGSCGELASRCHPYSKDSQLAKDCHELGHAGDDNACFPRRDECLAVCPLSDAGPVVPHFEASVPDATDGATEAGQDFSAICNPYCACLEPTCSAQTGYPFTSDEQCRAACASMSTEERDCLPKWCEHAKTLANKTHECEHAWGKFGLDECETL
jgi:hypothetical protein